MISAAGTARSGRRIRLNCSGKTGLNGNWITSHLRNSYVISVSRFRRLTTECLSDLVVACCQLSAKAGSASNPARLQDDKAACNQWKPFPTLSHNVRARLMDLTRKAFQQLQR